MWTDFVRCTKFIPPVYSPLFPYFFLPFVRARVPSPSYYYTFPARCCAATTSEIRMAIRYVDNRAGTRASGSTTVGATVSVFRGEKDYCVITVIETLQYHNTSPATL